MAKTKKKQVTQEQIKAALKLFLSSGGLIKKLPPEKVIRTQSVFISELLYSGKTTSIRMQT
ncbi:hypothetical protein LCGC14_1573530 [marine sediment metagenome]|uniref:Uncharacterized protein n=1 Tax=marine sediment metagenome TaxID=412755 RepID=A0A0F9J5A5_9ZZZZ